MTLPTAESIAAACTHGGPYETGFGGRKVPARTYNICHTCAEAVRAAYDAECQAWQAARPKCEACEKRPATCRLGWADRAHLCGRCSGRVTRYYNSNLASPFWMPGPVLSRERIIELARTPKKG